MNLSREVFLLAGGPGSGKSYSVAVLVKQLQAEGKKFVIIDRERGLEKALKEVGVGVLSEDEHPRILRWPDVEKAVDYAVKNLGRGDWLIFEMLNTLWDLVQSYYSEVVYNEDPIGHLLDLRQQAEARIRAGRATRENAKERMAATAYGGFEGHTDWTIIKRMHNDRALYKAIYEGEFSILSTSSLETPDGAVPPPFTAIKQKPGGEKTQPQKHDTIAFAYQQGGKYYWRTDLLGTGKDRGGRKLVKDIEMTGMGFVKSYLDYHGLA